MKSMMMSESEKKEMNEYSVVSDRPKYPYNLKLRIDPETYKKLEMGEPPKIGEKFMVLAQAEVCEVEMYRKEGDEKEFNIELQITDMDLKSSDQKEESESKDMASKIYG